MASTIGIKIANGEFYPIVTENTSIKKRLILTTVHDRQRSVQIDLYKSYAKSMADALYIGSLVVENINLKPKGEPSIEMVIASTAEGEITADATDLDLSSKAEHHHLSVSLKSLDEDSRDYDIPDFELEQHESPPRELYERVTNHQVQRSGVPWIPIIIIGLAIILTGLALWFFLLRGRGTAEGPPPPAGESEAPVIRAAESSPTATAAAQAPAQSGQAPGRPAQTPAQPAQAPAQPVQAAPQPAQAPARPAQAASLPAQAPARPAQAAPQPAQAPARARTSPPVASYRAPPVIPPEGVLYTIRWGDTLWDIAAAFYRNPWLYTRIARYNNIADPDHIVSGTSLRILPK